jgi:carbon-monoxide dehydrogenase large subunit
MGQFGIGQPVRRFEDRRPALRQRPLPERFEPAWPGLGHVLRSPHAHAAIRAIDLD